jgi:hypothetical protein
MWEKYKKEIKKTKFRYKRSQSQYILVVNATAYIKLVLK